LGRKAISRRTVRWLIVLHPKQNVEDELKWQTNVFCHGSCKSLLVDIEYGKDAKMQGCILHHKSLDCSQIINRAAMT